MPEIRVRPGLRYDEPNKALLPPPPPIHLELRDLLVRRRVLISLCIVAAGLIGVAYTHYVQPAYVASSVIRFEVERVDVPQLVEVLYSDNLISTEIEVLRGRAAATAVVDSLSLRARLLTPRHGQVTALFAVLKVATRADTGTLVVKSLSDGTFSVSRPGVVTPLGIVRLGDTLNVDGILLALAPQAARHSEIGVHIEPLDVAVRRFGHSLDVSRPARDADLIEIQVRSADPALAAAAANLMASNLIADRQVARLARTDVAVEFLEHQQDSLSLELRAAEDSLRVYQQREQVIDVPDQVSADITRLSKLQADLAGVRAERDALATLVAQLRQPSASQTIDGPGVSRRLMAFPALLSNQSASVLLGSLAQVESERAQLLIRRTLDDSDVQVLTHRIRDIETQLQGIAESYLQGLSNQVTALEGEANRFRQQLDALPEKALQTARRERTTKVLSDLWILVQTRLKEAQVSVAGGAPNARIVDPATLPTSPSSPRPLINLAVALVLGTVAGLTASLAVELGRRPVRSRADALSAAGLPVLGAFPRLRLGSRARRRLRSSIGNARVGAPDGSGVVAPRAGGVDNERDSTIAALKSLLVTGSATSAAYIESLNQLFATLTLGYREQPLKVVVFTSPLPGEGKTLSAINFALIGASRGLKMLLIDADLRCGVVSNVLGCRRDPGFAELLDGSAQQAEALRQISLGENESLTVLPSGVLPKVPGRVLTLERIREALATLTPKFDFVVIDTPPVNLLADAALLGSAADAVLLVVRAGHTQVDDLSYAMDQLEAAGAPILGTLLNDIDLKRNTRDDGSYRYLAEVGRYSGSAN